MPRYRTGASPDNPKEAPVTSITPEFGRVLLAMARMAEGIAKAARLLAASEEDEAGDALLSIGPAVEEEGLPHPTPEGGG